MTSPTQKPSAEALPASESSPSYPDYMLDPDAILKDDVTWRYGAPPNYSSTRKVYRDEKRCSHQSGSLESLVENLVKNWEIEASHKTKVSEWRTVDPDNYTFSINGGPPQDAEHMLKVGTYNAIIAPSQYYSPKHSDFEKSHKTFRDMMPNFAWEVLEVYSPPPVVAFRWRHWGWMKQDYAGWNSKGEKITIKGHGGRLDIQGVTVARLNDKLQVTGLETWFDPVDMFNQMKPDADTDASDVEVAVDGKKLNDTEANEVLNNMAGGGDSGVEDLTRQVNGTPDTRSLAHDIEEGTNNKPLVDDDAVHLHHPGSPAEQQQQQQQQQEGPHDHSAGTKVGESPVASSAAAAAAAAPPGGSCPFLNAQ